MADTDEEVQPQGAEATETNDATDAAEASQGKGPWYDDLVSAGLEGDQLSAMDDYMRSQQGRFTTLEQELASYKKSWADVDPDTQAALSELGRDLSLSAEDTFKKLVEVAEQQGLDPAAVLGYSNTDAPGESEDDDDDPLDLDDDPLADYPDDVRETIQWAKQEQERRAKEEADRAFQADMQKAASLEDWYVKDESGNTIKDGNGEPVSVFDEELWTLAVANYGPDVARRAYAEKFHPLALAKYQQDNPRQSVDVTDQPSSLKSSEGVAGAPPRGNESIFQISERLAQNYAAARAKDRT